ncbi:39S ribosomal protein L39, mitochondrial [Oncorhynchus tshawytscha]|uniref:Large ribosomal subunit protein mL39 n=1 Tax=Oncorhynchus tshawytscha TaxID=74940 RepID=A0A8C8I244_ONCTS|nr:39S ribosomal protein L39, mitochondrial [Oncorhynchus tshawytscha]
MACRTACQLLQRRLASSAASVRLSAAEVRGRRSAVFSREQARQRSLYPRTEKIEVTLQIPGLQGTLLVMNKGLSTPHSCARHLTEWYVTSSALALVDGKPWSLHQPLTQSCSLSLLTFKDTDPLLVNQAYWRSCAALLGQVLQDAFKEDFSVELLSLPEVLVTSGAFCCDVVLDPQLDAWNPSEESLRSLTRGAQQLIHRDLPWEPLEVAPPVALEVFSHSRCKQKEVEEKSAQSPKGTVILYRCGDHVLLSGGPLVARTGLCSQYEVTAIHPLGEGKWGLHRRAQGLSLPLQQQAHHTVWRKLRSRAEKLVEVPTGSTNEAISDTLTLPSAPEQTPPHTPQQ